MSASGFQQRAVYDIRPDAGSATGPAPVPSSENGDDSTRLAAVVRRLIGTIRSSAPDDAGKEAKDGAVARLKSDLGGVLDKLGYSKEEAAEKADKITAGIQDGRTDLISLSLERTATAGRAQIGYQSASYARGPGGEAAASATDERAYAITIQQKLDITLDLSSGSLSVERGSSVTQSFAYRSESITVTKGDARGLFDAVPGGFGRAAAPPPSRGEVDSLRRSLADDEDGALEALAARLASQATGFEGPVALFDANAEAGAGILDDFIGQIKADGRDDKTVRNLDALNGLLKELNGPDESSRFGGRVKSDRPVLARDAEGRLELKLSLSLAQTLAVGVRDKEGIDLAYRRADGELGRTGVRSARQEA